MNAYNLRQQCSKEKTKATNPKLSKCTRTRTVRSLDYQRQNIIKQIKHSVLQVKAGTLPVTFLLITVTNWQWNNPFPAIPNHFVRHLPSYSPILFSWWRCFCPGFVLLFWSVFVSFWFGFLTSKAAYWSFGFLDVNNTDNKGFPVHLTISYFNLGLGFTLSRALLKIAWSEIAR